MMKTLDEQNKVMKSKDINYWYLRCMAAEKCIAESPCDPDITSEQIKAHRHWEEIKDMEHEK